MGWLGYYFLRGKKFGEKRLTENVGENVSENVGENYGNYFNQS